MRISSYLNLRLKRDFFCKDPITLAKKLLGKILVRIIEGKMLTGKIVETESYLGVDDPACHAYRGKITSKNKILYQEPGRVYIYSIYGSYFCFNIVANKKGIPASAFIRAIEPLEGIELMKEFRKTENIKILCNGPAKLCQAFNINKEFYGEDLVISQRLFIVDNEEIPEDRIIKTTRVNIDYAQEAKFWKLRFYIKENKFISKK